MIVLPELNKLNDVRAVAIDRLRWWREQGEAQQQQRQPQRKRTALLAPDMTFPHSTHHTRSGSLPASSHRAAPPQTAFALRHPPLLLFMRGGATLAQHDAIRRALREGEDAVRLTTLSAAERDFYRVQLNASQTSSMRDRRKGWKDLVFASMSSTFSRRRAASAPALPPTRLYLGRQRGKRQENTKRFPIAPQQTLLTPQTTTTTTTATTAHQQQQIPTSVTATALADHLVTPSNSLSMSTMNNNNNHTSNNKLVGVGLPVVLRPAHECRRVVCLQDTYAFHPDRDFIGDGAFSQVFRAVRLFGDDPHASLESAFVAIKIIPRRRLRGKGVWVGNALNQSGLNTLGAGWREKGTEHTVAVNNRTASTLAPSPTHATTTLTATATPMETRRRSRLDALHRELVEIEREISILRTVHHSGCSRFVEALRTPDEYVIVMKMGKGCLDGRRFLQRYGPPSEIRVALLIFQLLSTVNYLHLTHGIIHRDIKLENLLLSCADVSLDRIQEVLGNSNETPRRPRRHPSNVVDDRNSTERETDRDDVNKCEKHTTSSWWTSAADAISAQHDESDEWRRLLRVTLIDFGFARRTGRRGERCRASRGHPEAMSARVLANETLLRRAPHIGMPTPLPSVPNMFMTMDDEDTASDASGRKGGASSTDVSASETSSETLSSEDEHLSDEEEEENYSHAEDEPKGGGEGKKKESERVERSHEAADRTPVAAAPRTPPSPPPLPAAFTPQEVGMAAWTPTGTPAAPKLQEASDAAGDGGAVPTITAAAVPTSFSFSFSLSPAPSPQASYRSVSAEHRDGETVASSAVPDVQNRSYREEAPDEGETMLFLTPCGTDKYLPPEMLSWIVDQGWERKPTSVRVARKLDVYAIGIVTYVLLSGCFPFNGASRATMAQQQRRGAPKCMSEHWQHISGEAIGFVQSLLQPDPNERSSAAEALAHPWMRRAALLADKLHLVPTAADGELPTHGEASCAKPRQTPKPRAASQQSPLPQPKHGLMMSGGPPTNTPREECVGGNASTTQMLPHVFNNSVVQSGGGDGGRLSFGGLAPSSPSAAMSLFAQIASSNVRGRQKEETHAIGEKPTDKTDDEDGDDPFTRMFKTVMSE